MKKIILFIIRWLANLNYKYDKVQEPKRFFIALGMMAPFLVSDSIAILTDSRLFNVLGFIWVILLIGIRIWYLVGNLKKYLR